MARIIIIDDDDLVRRTLSETLKHHGHTVGEASNGKDGLDLVRRSGADLVITDIVMPGTEGTEVVIELRKRHPSVKVMAISGGGRQGTSDYLKIATYLGASKVLSKPFSGDVFMAAVNEVLPSPEDGSAPTAPIGGPSGSTSETPFRPQG
jgi:DNA-binding NarL/FixJ family response regulator